MNAYGKLDDNDWHAKEEARDLALMAALIHPFNATSFGEGISIAWETLNKGAEFLAEKRKIKEAEAKVYWESPEGQARRAEAIARFEKRAKGKTTASHPENPNAE